MSEQTCCATQANYEHCKYGTNRGWRDTSRYAELFGTPEKAARTLENLFANCNNGFCFAPEPEDASYDALLELLRGDAE